MKRFLRVPTPLVFAVTLPWGVAYAQPYLEPSQSSGSPAQSGPMALGNALDVAGRSLRLINPSISYSYMYGDGVPSSQGRAQKTSIHRLSPSLEMRFAEHFSLSYTPSFVWYSSDSFEDRTNHRVALSGVATVINDVWLRASQTYSYTSYPLYETGEQTAQEDWVTSLDVRKPISDRFSVDVQGGYSARKTERFTDSESYNTFGWLRRSYGERLSVGLGAGGAYIAMDPGSDFYSYEAKSSLGWGYGDKISVSVEAGVNISEFADGTGGSSPTPVYAGTVYYQFLETTSVSAGIRRSVSSSYYSNQFTERAYYNLSLTQRFIGRLQLTATFGYSEVDYVAKSQELETDRSDEVWSYGVQVSSKVLQKLNAAVFWNYDRHKSSRSTYWFDSSFVGGSLSYQF